MISLGQLRNKGNVYCFPLRSGGTISERSKWYIAFCSTRETHFRTRKIYLAFSYTRVTRFVTSILLATRLQNEGNKEQGKYISVLLSVPLAVNTHCRESREFTKPRRQRERERRWAKELMNRTMVLHVRYNCWYISLSSSAKRRLEMTKFCVIWRTWTPTANF